jgi:AcrR family transcriptional regulator
MPPVRSPHQVAARQLLRTTLLEAARELLRTRRWTDITMADIATASGVSRQTLYNEFGSRAGFVQTYLLYDADRILSAVEQAVAAADPEPLATIEHAFRIFLQTIAEDPLAVTILSGDDPDGLLALVTTRGGPVLQVAAQRLGGAIHLKWPQAGANDVQVLAEQLVRLAISHAALPDDDMGETAKAIAHLLAPFAEVALLRADLGVRRA